MKSISIIIADDEAFSRYALRTIITKNFPNASISAEAQDGLEVFTKAKKYKPDLILMDIKMPGMNGIDASEKILNELPETKIIILSAYDYFNYAQKSLETGVCAYLLKPFKEKQIVEKIESLNFEAIPRRNTSGDIVNYLENELLSMITTPWGKEPGIKKIMSFLGISENPFGIFICASYRKLSSNRMEWLRNILSEGINGISGETAETDFCFLGLFNDKNSASDYIERLGPDFKKIVDTAECCLGASKPAGLKQLSTAYRQAVLSLRHSRTTGQPVIYHDGLAAQDFEELYPYDLEEKFLQTLFWEDFQQGWSLLEELCAEILNTSGNHDFQTEKLVSLYLLMKHSAMKAGFFENILNSDFTFNSICDLDDNSLKIKFILDFYNNLEKSAKSRFSENQNRKLSKAFLHIQQNIFTDISLESAADFAGISPQYLSRRFKEKYGVNFIDYLTTQRINHARYLLKSSDMNIKEIASEVGYSDPNYFSRVFRKITDSSPQQYRIQS